MSNLSSTPPPDGVSEINVAFVQESDHGTLQEESATTRESVDKNGVTKDIEKTDFSFPRHTSNDAGKLKF